MNPDRDEYLSGRVPDSIPPGKVLVRNAVVVGITPRRTIGTRGFRAWLSPAEDHINREPCTCAWAPELGNHYRTDGPSK